MRRKIRFPALKVGFGRLSATLTQISRQYFVGKLTPGGIEEGFSFALKVRQERRPVSMPSGVALV